MPFQGMVVHANLKSIFGKNIAQLLIGFFAGGYALNSVYKAYVGYIHRSDYLYWDPAAHAFYGVKLSAAVESLNPIRMLSVLNEQVLWPPLHSILQVPFMLLLGKSFLTSSVCSMTFLVLFFVALTFCYQQVSKSWLGLVVLLSLAISSPYLLAYGSMAMLEIFGVTLAAVSAGLYLKGSKWFPLSLTLLFFLKYNYCMFVLIAFVCTEYGAQILRQFQQRLRLMHLSGFQIFVIVYVVVLLGIFVTGGFEIGPLSVRGIGNPLYLLYLIVVARVIVKRQYIGLWEKLSGTGWEWFVLPVAVWLLIPIPNRVKTLVSFFVNAPLSGHSPGQLSYYTFYFEHLSDYFASPAAMAFCLAIALLCIIYHRRDKRILFLGISFVLPFLMMTFNQNKQERYLYTFIFPLWLLAASFMANLAHTTGRSVFALAISAIAIFSYAPSKMEALVGWPFIPLCYEEPLEFIASSTKDANDITVIGTTNEMSPALILYHLEKKDSFRGVKRFSHHMDKPVPGSHLFVINQIGAGKLATLSNYNLKEIETRNFDGCTTVEHYVVLSDPAGRRGR